MRTVAQTRKSIKDKLEIDFPWIEWREGRIPEYLSHRTQAYGAISSSREAMADDAFYTTRNIVVQIFLPVSVIAAENQTLADSLFVNPAGIEDLSAEVINSLYEIDNQTSGSWYIRWNQTVYPSDPNGQQTRANIEFIAVEQSPDWGT